MHVQALSLIEAAKLALEHAVKSLKLYPCGMLPRHRTLDERSAMHARVQDE